MHLEFLGSQKKHQGQEFHQTPKTQGNGERPPNLTMETFSLNDDAPRTPTNRCGYRQSDPCDYPSEKTDRDQAVSSQGLCGRFIPWEHPRESFIFRLYDPLIAQNIAFWTHRFWGRKQVDSVNSSAPRFGKAQQKREAFLKGWIRAVSFLRVLTFMGQSQKTPSREREEVSIEPLTNLTILTA